MTEAREPAVQLLLDRAEIHDLMVRYALGVDRCDFELVASCFAPDMGGRWGPGEIEGRDALIDYVSGVARFHTTMHFMGNQFIEVAGDAASAETYAMLTHRATRRRDGAEWEYTPSNSLYRERLERRDRRWVIVERGASPAWAPTGVTAVQTDDPAVRWLLDRAEIHDLMVSYALGVDERDYDRIRACFAPRFRARYGEHEFTDADTLIAFIRGVERFHSTTHFLGSQLIEVHSDDASMETSALITHREGDDGSSEWVGGGGRYIDRLVRHEGHWRFADRGPQCPRVPTESASPPRSADPEVRALVDRAEIHDLTVTFAYGLDRRDYDLVRSCLAPEARGGVAGGELAPAERFVDALAAEEERWHRTKNLLGNQLIALDGDRASVETYAYVTHQEGPRSLPSHWSRGATRYLDELERIDGRWRIRERRIEGPYSRPPEGKTGLPPDA